MRLMSESCFSFLEKEGFRALIGLRAMDLTLDSRISKGFKIFFLLSFLNPYNVKRNTRKIKTVRTMLRMLW